MGSETSRERSPGHEKPPSPRGRTKKLTRSSRRFSVGGAMTPPMIKMGSSISCNVDPIPSQNGERTPSREHSDSRLSVTQTPRSRSGSTASNSKSCALTLKNRQLIQSCFQNQFAESIGQRILKRAAEKRNDFGKFYISISSVQREEFADMIKWMLKKCVSCIESSEELQRVATEEGQRFVQFRIQGFKADYFAVLADSTITECVFLDNAIHPAHQTLIAFSQLITMLFSSVRDGFYNEMRRLRRTSNSFSSGSTGGRKKESVEDIRSRETSPRSLSPAEEYFAQHGSVEEGGTIFGRDFVDGEPTDYYRVEKENNWPPMGYHQQPVVIDENGLLMPPQS